MPFQSNKQQRFMWANHPDIARRWTKKYGSVSKKAIRKKLLKGKRRADS